MINAAGRLEVSSEAKMTKLGHCWHHTDTGCNERDGLKINQQNYTIVQYFHNLRDHITRTKFSILMVAIYKNIHRAL